MSEHDPRMVIQPTNGTCLVAAVSMLTGTRVLLREPYPISVDAVIDDCWRLGIGLVPIFFGENESGRFRDDSSRLEWYISRNKCVLLIESLVGKHYHAVYWDGSLVWNPIGRTESFKDLLKQYKILGLLLSHRQNGIS